MRPRKPLLMLILLALACSCSEDSTGPGKQSPARWRIDPDSLNFAVLVLDYLSYRFEGGDLSYYAPCASCDQDSLPFLISSIQPGDFGWMLFRYSVTGDTLFYATAVWNGLGRIEYPREIAPPDSFGVKSRGVRQPPEPEYYIYYYQLYRDRNPSPETIAATDSCWASISKLDIVRSFAQAGPFKAAYLAYHRRFGVFDITKSKWVVFLFRKND